MALKTIQYRGVYQVLDTDLRLHPHPDDRNQKDTNKKRYFVVLSNREVCYSDDWKYVVGCPTSTDDDQATEYCVHAPKGAGNLPQDCWIRVPAVQPLDKSVLHKGQCCGELKGDPRERLEEAIVDMIGLLT